MGILHDEAPGAFLYDARGISVVPKGLSVGPYNENYPFTVFFAPSNPPDPGSGAPGRAGCPTVSPKVVACSAS